MGRRKDACSASEGPGRVSHRERQDRSEGAGHSGEVAEVALSHAIGDKVEAAYRRGDLLEKRIALMTDRASFLGGVAAAKRAGAPRGKAKMTSPCGDES